MWPTACSIFAGVRCRTVRAIGRLLVINDVKRVAVDEAKAARGEIKRLSSLLMDSLCASQASILMILTMNRNSRIEAARPSTPRVQQLSVIPACRELSLVLDFSRVSRVFSGWRAERLPNRLFDTAPHLLTRRLPPLQVCEGGGTLVFGCWRGYRNTKLGG